MALLEKCISLDTRYILSVLRCLNHQRLLKLRPVEGSAVSPFQPYTHVQSGVAGKVARTV